MHQHMLPYADVLLVCSGRVWVLVSQRRSSVDIELRQETEMNRIFLLYPRLSIVLDELGSIMEVIGGSEGVV